MAANDDLRKPRAAGAGGDDAQAPRAAAAAKGAPAPGLHLVATPIGAARDITLRALDILAAADVIAAEDTRAIRRLMEIHGLPVRGRRIVSYHDHNGPRRRPALLAALKEGKSVALVSEAGTPLIADPGWKLVREAAAAGLPVTAAPGANAALTALCLSGLPTDRFLFAGFPPPRAGRRRETFAELAGVPATLVFYEAPQRCAASLADMAAVFGAARPAALCRELTKRFEEIRRAPLGELAEAAAEAPPRGEIVIVVAPPETAAPDRDALDAALTEALADASVKDAAQMVARTTGLPRREVYARALALRRRDTGG